MRIIVLLSGGIDSAVVLGALVENQECAAVAFDYGQPHRIELNHARKIARHYKVPFQVVKIPKMPLVDDVIFAGRNLVFVSVGVAYAQAKKFDAVAIGCNRDDAERFPDCREKFLCPLQACAEAYGVALVAPLLDFTKREVVARARKGGVPLELTWSCYSGSTVPCGHCMACRLREEALR